MTQEEAKSYFGEDLLNPTLETLTSNSENISCIVGKTYLRNATPGDWLYEITAKQGWTKLTCTFYRSGVNFLKIKGHNEEYPICDNSIVARKLIPETINLKKDFGLSPEIAFAFKTYNGLVKIS